MEYIYSASYGQGPKERGKKRLRDRHGDEMSWQHEYDKAVDKGLVQIMKEDKMPFPKLIAVLREETEKAMHSEDRWRVPAYQLMEKYTGSYGVGRFNQYWIEQLYPRVNGGIPHE